MLALSIPIWICVVLIFVGGVVQAWLMLRCSWHLPPPTGKLMLSLRLNETLPVGRYNYITIPIPGWLA